MRLAPRLIVFSDTTRAPPELMLARFAALAQHAEPGTVLFTLRDYTLSVGARLALGVELRTLAALGEQAFGLADRADLARALGAQAIHLPEAGLAVPDARRYLGPELFVSRACHELPQATHSGADAVLLSPIFEARKGRPALGLGALEECAATCRRGLAAPAVYALGAVDAGNAAACVAAGAAGVAVIGAALAADPLPLLEALEIRRR
jgi:thiamine-phosphate pyrophosphorylase